MFLNKKRIGTAFGCWFLAGIRALNARRLARRLPRKERKRGFRVAWHIKQLELYLALLWQPLCTKRPALPLTQICKALMKDKIQLERLLTEQKQPQCRQKLFRLRELTLQSLNDLINIREFERDLL